MTLWIYKGKKDLWFYFQMTLQMMEYTNVYYKQRTMQDASEETKMTKTQSVQNLL